MASCLRSNARFHPYETDTACNQKNTKTTSGRQGFSKEDPSNNRAKYDAPAYDYRNRLHGWYAHSTNGETNDFGHTAVTQQ